MTNFPYNIPIGLCHGTCLVCAPEVTFLCMEVCKIFSPGSCLIRDLGFIWGTYLVTETWNASEECSVDKASNIFLSLISI